MSGRTLVRVLFGSQLYGTATPESDTDFKSVHIPPVRDILTCRAAPTVSMKTRQGNAEGQRNRPCDVDDESFALHKYLAMLVRGDMVAVELLFARGQNLLVDTAEWMAICGMRDKLISRNCTGFIGYCQRQAAKYGIKGSRIATCRAALKLVEGAGSQARLGALEPSLVEFALCTEHTSMTEVDQANGTKLWHWEVCDRKLPLTISVGEARQVLQKVLDNYGERTLAAERSEGVDWKAVAHAVRVGQQAIELLTTGTITFPRPNAAILLQIKRGERPYPEIASVLEGLLQTVKEKAATSTLPREVDPDLVDDIVFGVYGKQVVTEWER